MWPLALALLAVAPVTREPRLRHALLAPGDIYRRLDASPRTYKVEEEDAPTPEWYRENAAVEWGSAKDDDTDVLLVDLAPDGSRRVRIWQPPEGSVPALAAAQRLFDAKDWAGAEAAFAKVVQQYPSHYLARLSWGDCAANMGHFALALERYEKATPLAPLDHRGWYARGNALLGLGRKAEAVSAYARALSLRPRSEPLRAGLERHPRRLGLTLRRDLFLPHARVTEKDDAVTMRCATQPHWLAWASCKALWLGEESHRREMTGRDEHSFTNVEEEECLANLAAAYQLTTKAKKGYTPDPTAQLAYDASEAGLLEPFVLYELASRVDPTVMLQLPDEERAKVEAFIRRFVLVPAP